MNLGEVSNILAGLNASRLGLSRDHLEKWAMNTVELGYGNGVKGELADQRLYEYGYIMGFLEARDGVLSDKQIINAIEAGLQSRRNFIKYSRTNN